MIEQDHINELREELDRDIQVFERAQRCLGAVSGADDHEVLEVRLGAAGNVESVTARPQWRDHYDTGALAEAFLGVYAAAVSARNHLYSSEFEAADPGRARPLETSLNGVADAVDRGFASDDARVPVEFVRALDSMIGELNQALDDASAAVDTQMERGATGQSTSGHVRASVGGGGGLAALDIDEKWLRSAHDFNVGREVTEAILDAQRRFAEESVDVLETSGLGRLQRLTQDPETFARYLGL